jgi:hypothetical protein
MVRVILGLLSFILSVVWWIVDKQYGDELFKKVRAMIPKTILPESLDGAFELAVSYAPVFLFLLGIALFLVAILRGDTVRVVFAPVKVGMDNEKVQLMLPIKSTAVTPLTVRVVMEIHKLTGKWIGEYVLTSEERIKRGDTIVSRINLDRRPKRFLLFNYFPLKDQFNILAEGGANYTIPTDNYRVTVEVVGDKLQGSKSYTIVKDDRDLHFSDGTASGSFDVKIQTASAIVRGMSSPIQYSVEPLADLSTSTAERQPRP